MVGLKAELHVHSNFSDGKDSVGEILKIAIEKRIDVISITDHDTVEGSLIAMELVSAEKIPVVVIPGIEISTKSGHLLAYGIMRGIEKGLGMRETCEMVRKLKGVSVLAHPFDFIRKGTLRREDFSFVDCVEVFNAKSYFNFLAKRYAKKFNKKGIGGSDAHTAKQIGIVINYIESSEKDSILNAIYDGRKQTFRERLSFLLSRINQKP
ncbi:MAG: PHP domain-containing protein [Archaeoglobaceae archaeon]|nr:PHP domain-containing protein [Archaeoglobaceae archaeon]MDW8117863.1 PHP domain-containing protein [Archaeoglobaceae archaeon]